MDIVSKLNDELLKQSFSEEYKQQECLNESKQMAFNYARIENSIAVLSDIRANVSYIYYGGVVERFGIAKRGDIRTVHSIWEEEILNRIHPDDLLKKHLQELRFFYFLKNISKGKQDYHLESVVRMRDASGVYIEILHRLFYVASYPNGSIWLALCLYNLFVGRYIDSAVVHSVDGQLIELEKHNCNNLLSNREKEVLKLINTGKMSKDIAVMLSISVNTVNRHRQNILEKLQVNNSIEACRIGKELNLL